MSNTEQSHCRIRRTGIVTAKEEAFAQVEVDGRTIVVPLNKCEPSIPIGSEITWNGKQWIAFIPDVQ